MSDLLPHVERTFDGPTFRICDCPPIHAGPVVGVHGGRRVPVRVEWRPVGTGFLTSGKRIDGKFHAALWPDVAWHNGDGKIRYTRARAWARMVKEGRLKPEVADAR